MGIRPIPEIRHGEIVYVLLQRVLTGIRLIPEIIKNMDTHIYSSILTVAICLNVNLFSQAASNFALSSFFIRRFLHNALDLEYSASLMAPICCISKEVIQDFNALGFFLGPYSIDNENLCKKK